MSTLHLPDKGRTYLQRAFAIFERMGPQLLSARTLAALMQVNVSTAYNYIKRLKALGCIQEQRGGKVPQYAIAPAAKAPPADSRGRKPREQPQLELEDLCTATGAE